MLDVLWGSWGKRWGIIKKFTIHNKRFAIHNKCILVLVFLENYLTIDFDFISHKAENVISIEKWFFVTFGEKEPLPMRIHCIY